MLTSPLVRPHFAAANDGTSASNADVPATMPAPVAAVRPRNCLRSVLRSSCFAIINGPPFENWWKLTCQTLYAERGRSDHGKILGPAASSEARRLDLDRSLNRRHTCVVRRSR